MRLTKEGLFEWLSTLMGFAKPNFNGCSLGNGGQLRIGGLLQDHFGIVLKTFSKFAGQGLAIEA